MASLAVDALRMSEMNASWQQYWHRLLDLKAKAGSEAVSKHCKIVVGYPSQEVNIAKPQEGTLPSRGNLQIVQQDQQLHQRYHQHHLCRSDPTGLVL